MSARARRVLAIIACWIGGAALFILILWVPPDYLRFRYFFGFGFMLLGLWSWKRGWQRIREDRRDRQRRWGIRKRVDMGDPVDAEGK